VYKLLAVLAALIPVIVTVLILSRLLDTRQLAERARLWALHMLGAPEVTAQIPTPAPTEGPFPNTPTGRQMENAYSELIKELGPQIKAEQICIEQTPEKLQIRFLEQVLFNTASAKITPQGQDILSRTGHALARIEGKPFTIVGYTDNVPISNDQYPSNWELSAARACSVVRFLSERTGIDQSRFFAVGRADRDPVADNATDAGRSKNRRVEVLVTDRDYLKLEGRDAAP
jgi:chemotaxis protein MotB